MSAKAKEYLGCCAIGNCVHKNHEPFYVVELMIARLDWIEKFMDVGL